MTPTTQDLMQIATDHSLFRSQALSYLQEYDKYVLECKVDGDEPMSLEDFMFEGEENLAAEYTNTAAWN